MVQQRESCSSAGVTSSVSGSLVFSNAVTGCRDRPPMPLRSRAMADTLSTTTRLWNSGRGPGAPAHFFTSESGLYSYRRAAAHRACTSRSHGPICASSGTVTGTGRLLVNRPTMRSTCVNSGGRPEVVTPMMTSLSAV